VIAVAKTEMFDHLWNVIQIVEERFRAAGRVFLFLDFDGTLAPIETDFAAPRLDAAVRDTLRLLSSRPSVVITIISGRAVEDLFARIRLQSVIYAGNHGLEVFGHGLRFVDPLAADLRARLARLSDEIAARLRPIAGAIVECKGLTATVHFRQAGESDHAEIRESIRVAVGRENGFRLIHGLKAIEILPRSDWNKGAAANWVINQLGGEDALAIYLGDDAADEEAFLALPGAITIKVGVQPTRARFRLPGPAEVHEFLRRLAAAAAPRAQTA
jgi:trehalose-phosphatase